MSVAVSRQMAGTARFLVWSARLSPTVLGPSSTVVGADLGCVT
jgi:hypothetical protein